MQYICIVYINAGGNAVNGTCVTGAAGIRDCVNQRTDYYQNCYRCDVFSPCEAELLQINPCSPGTVFDANRQQCTYSSSTCLESGAQFSFLSLSFFSFCYLFVCSKRSHYKKSYNYKLIELISNQGNARTRIGQGAHLFVCTSVKVHIG